jgi:hypothetical protein
MSKAVIRHLAAEVRTYHPGGLPLRTRGQPTPQRLSQLEVSPRPTQPRNAASVFPVRERPLQATPSPTRRRPTHSAHRQQSQSASSLRGWPRCQVTSS